MVESVPAKGISRPMLSPAKALKKKKGKFVSAAEAVGIIRDGDTIGTEGFLGAGFPEEIAVEIEDRFLKTGNPRNLRIVYAAGQGDGKDRGLNHLGHEGLVGTVIGGHIGLAPKIQKLISANKIFAYNFPQGIVTHLFRDIAAGKPGTISSVGLGTFIDPRGESGKLNELTRTRGEDLIELITLSGKEYLLYKTFPVNVAILRGTTADPDGNITMEREALTLENLAMAMAAKNSGGIVMVQVERMAERGSLNAREVKIPGILVDFVVVAKPENHWQTFAERYNPSYSCETKIPMGSIAPMEMGARKIIARRAAFELKPHTIVNLGIGMPEGVAQVANEEKVIRYVTLTAEPGVIGGMPNNGYNFGTGTNMDCLIDQPYMFDFYDGGGLDAAFLGAAEVDRQGNVNVSKFGPRFVGPGGFINISQNCKELIFVGTLTAGGLQVAVEDGRLRVVQEGREIKFVDKVNQITFSGPRAVKLNQPVLYVTERCVFSLCAEGLELIEIAPGIDIEKDIFSQMAFKPVIKAPPKPMDLRIFRKDPMGLRDEMLSHSIDDRLTYDAEENIFFVDFENYYLKSSSDIHSISNAIEKILAPLDRKVNTIVNYNNFNIAPDLVDEYADMVRYVMRYYSEVTRYTSSTFLRLKLGDELARRDIVPYMFQTGEEARGALKELARQK
ncbi:MAG: acyl CoA:acetate/3-ketoacid CoA transferase [Syntrophobacteraceae bacterium]